MIRIVRPVRFVTLLSLCFAIAVSATACRTTYHELELQPDGDTMQRKVSVWLYKTEDGVKTYDEFSESKLRHISQLYGVPMPTILAQRHEFEGRFQRRLPADVGDGGWYLNRTSMLGSVNSYIEHVDGGHKISWDLETRQAGLHRLIDVWLAWLDSEFGEDQRYPDFREFVDVVIRDDLWNVALYLWSFDMFGLVGADDSGEDAEIRLISDVSFRIGIYLAEQGYVDPVELPEMFQRVLAAPDEESEDLFLSMIMRGLATKFGTNPDEPLPWPFGEVVADPDAYATSFERFVTESDTIRVMAETWEREYRDSLSPSENALAEARPDNLVDPKSEKSIDSQLTSMAFAVDLDFFSTSGSEALQIILHVPQKPAVTNGNWESDGTLRWNNNISPGGHWGSRLPDVFYAVWDEPAVDFQEEHFGKLVMEGEDLIDHVAWYMSLSPEQLQEWETLLRGLEPGPKLIATLQNFCFSSELPECQAKTPPRSEIAASTLRKIVRALGSEQPADPKSTPPPPQTPQTPPVPPRQS